MVFIADHLAAWLISVLADFGRYRLLELVLGDEVERALRSVATGAVRRTAAEFHPDDENRAASLTMVINEVFDSPATENAHARNQTVLHGLQAGIAEKIALLSDTTITGTGQSSLDALGVNLAELTRNLTDNLVWEIVARGTRGGPLFPLASQLNDDITHFQGREIEIRLGRLEELIRAMSPPGSQGVTVPLWMENSVLDLPPMLPAVWVRLGDLQHAIGLARSIPDAKHRTGELARMVVEALGNEGDASTRTARIATRVLLLALAGRDIPEWETLAAQDLSDDEYPSPSWTFGDFLIEELMPDPDIMVVVTALARAGLRDEAHGIVGGLGEPENHARALAEIAASFAADDPQRATRIVAQAENEVRLIDRSGYAPGVDGEKAKQACALADMAVSLAGHDPQHAACLAEESEVTARGIAHAFVQSETVARVAKILAGTYPQQAARMATDADQVLGDFETPWSNRQALRVPIASALAAVGLCQRAGEVAHNITDPDHKDCVLSEIAQALAESGEPDRAIDLARRIAGNWYQACALTGIAAALADADPEQATHLAQEAATAARESE